MKTHQPKRSPSGVLVDSRLCFGVVAWFVLVASSCTDSNNKPADIPITVRDSSVIAQVPDCKGLLEECGGVQITFPVYSNGTDSALNVINKRIEAFFVDQLGYAADETGPAPTLKEAAALFIEEYLATKEEFPYMNQVWVVQGTATSLTADSVICTEAEVFAYMGGAHANSELMFDLSWSKTGKRVEISELSVDYNAFLQAAEAAFKHTVGMSESDSDYSAQGFWFKDNKFTLPANIGVTNDSIILHYNAYEIAPYSMGTFRCTLPRSILTAPI